MKVLSRICIGVMLLAGMCGCSSKSALDGKLVDVKGQPIAGVKIVAKQVQGSNQAETTTGQDGVFSFKELIADKEYELVPYFDSIIKTRATKVTTGPKGKSKKLADNLTILFVPSKDGLVVRDTALGLMWVRDAGKMEKMNWEEAMNSAEQFNYAGFSDWRLPTKFELKALTFYASPKPAELLNQDVFTKIQASPYWSSDINEKNKAFAWAVNMADGKSVNDNKVDFKYSVLLVRSAK